MPPASCLSAILLGLPAAFAYPSPSPRQVANITTSSAVIITGATEGGPQPRLEIHDLMNDDDQWNIYLLALQSFQQMDSSDPLSWYQIGGVHGRPFSEYNGSPQCEGCGEHGYCTHSSTLFPTWHRAYVALFEQSLQANALAVANQFTGPDREKYVAAATNLRSPYWDWALPMQEDEPAFPEILQAPSVTVTTPNGTSTINNPLPGYTFPAAAESFTTVEATTRNPTFSQGIRNQLRSDLWSLLTSPHTYNEFSTRALNVPRANPGNLESVHDGVHVDVGGDMANPETAGFDPVFWLHHTMVDRVLSLYQAVNSTSWLQTASEVGDSFTYTVGAIKDSTSVLQPFAVDSDTVRDTGYFNYVYPEITDYSAAADLINDLYGSGNPSLATSKRSASGRDDGTAARITHEYLAKVSVDLPGTAGSFSLFIFDGEPDPTSPERWYKDEDFLGQHGFFTNDAVRGNREEISTASVSLTSMLKERMVKGELAGMEPETVADYLRAKMQWRIVNGDGKELKRSRIPKLQVEVLSAEVVMPMQRGSMPVWGEFGMLVGCEDEVGAWVSGWCGNA